MDFCLLRSHAYFDDNIYIYWSIKMVSNYTLLVYASPTWYPSCYIWRSFKYAAHDTS